MYARWMVTLLACLLLGIHAGVCQAADGIEFTEVHEAKGFGWDVTDDTKLTITRNGKVGRYALLAQPLPDAKPYQGFELLHNFDLTGAGPADTIVFQVKQNFGSGMRVQLWTDNGAGINRSFRLNQDKWNLVRLDLDMAHWANPKKAPWGKMVRMQFYETSFMKPEHYMILDGLAVTVGGKSVLAADPVRTMQKWTYPHQNESAWFVGNTETAWAISKTTGQVLGGWNVQTKERYLNSLEGRYHLEDRKSLVTGRESEDKIVQAKFLDKEQRVELTCSNPKVPDLIIKKQYWPSGNKLFQRIAFTTRSKELQFVTYNSETVFTHAYREGSYYMGGSDGGGPLIPAPNLSEWKRVVQYQNTTKGMLLHQPNKDYSFVHMRTKLDDRFVWPYFTGAVASYVEASNMLHYTPDGWDMSLGTSKLSTEKETSYTQYVSIFKGDWQTFLRSEYPALPEVQEALAEIPPVPDWVGDIKIAAGSDMHRLRKIVKMTDEGTIMVLVCLSGSWSDYYVDRGLEGGFGGRMTGEELKDFVDRIKALSPRIKVGLYMWALSATDNTRIYKEHPEWFRYGNKDGEPLSTFPGVSPNYAHLLSIPECYNEILSQFDLVFSYLDVDYIMLDDPKAINMIDWKSGEYTRDDMSFRFFLDIKKIAAKHGPDKMIFFNNQCNPYGDINYIEARGKIRAQYWRNFVGISAVNQEFVSATRPKARIVLLYFTPPTKREYMGKTLALGWVPSLTYCDVIASRAFFQAAYEVGNCRAVPARYSPDWKRDDKTHVESFSVQRQGDKGYILSFINHAEKDETVTVQVDLESLNLDQAKQVFVWEYMVENPLEFEGSVTESLARKIYAQTGWQPDRVTRRRLAYAGPYRKQVELKIAMKPLLLHQLYITAEPVAVYSENSLPANYLFGWMPKVTLNTKADWQKNSMNIEVDSSRDEAEIMAFLPLASYRLERVSLDGQPVAPDLVCEGEDIFPVMKVGKGHHTLALVFAAAADTKPAQVKNFRAGESLMGASISLSGYDKALLTVAKDNHVLFNRMVTGKAGRLSLPVSPVRKDGGEYIVSLRAVIDGNGRLQPVTGAQASLNLSSAMPDLGLGPEKPPRVPAQREITMVNRKIQGLEILRSATLITDTIPGEVMPDMRSMMANVRPEDLTLEAGTTRKIGPQESLGAAFAGLEIKNLRKVKVKLANTFHNAFHVRGPGNHVPPRPHSGNFAGIVVDYHTPQGYTRRVSLAVGVLHKNCSSPYPNYGRSAVADEFRDLGSSLIETPEATFALDLQRYAPKDWDGQVWFSVGCDWIAPNRRLKLQILAANDAVSGEFLSGVDPKAFLAAYNKPRTLHVPRSPGGIIIDGSPDEEMWRGSAITDQFFLYGGVGVPKAKTTAQLLYDDTYLYVAYTCEERDRRKPLIIGGPAYNDDEVEVLLDINCDRKTWQQVIVNAANSKLEYASTGSVVIGAKTAVQVNEGDSWMVEMAIPFAGLGVKPPAPGDTWRLSLCRHRPAGKNFNTELIVWAALKNGGFLDVENFGTMIFK